MACVLSFCTYLVESNCYICACTTIKMWKKKHKHSYEKRKWLNNRLYVHVYKLVLSMCDKVTFISFILYICCVIK